jgi:arabinogalactan oligomer/maltooligosaccharide transport system permease protein
MNEHSSTIKSALADGDVWTRLSTVVMGAGMLGHRQVAKGVLVLLLEVAFWLST